MLLQILNIVTNPKCCCYLFLFPLASWFQFQFRFRLQFWFRFQLRFRLQFWLWFQLRFWFWQSYFIKLFDADLQCEFIRTFFLLKIKITFKISFAPSASSILGILHPPPVAPLLILKTYQLLFHIDSNDCVFTYW